jgi:RluA family pseudouridine synthase
VGPDQTGLTLQDLLAARLGLSRNKAKALLDQRRVFVNGVRVWMAHHTLRSGDQVEVPSPSPPSPAQPTWRVLHEDDHLLALDKPAGIETTGPDSAEERLRQVRREPGLRAAHRLDRDTTGCWLVARDEATQARLIERFSRNEVRKFYHALARGFFPDAERTIRNKLDGLEAVTHVKRLDANPDATHLLIRIETGRTHQIRRHLAALGHPILGDTHYAGKQALSPRERSVRRHMLHASEIRLPHPNTNNPLRVVSPLPADFLACLREFGLT